ncbi:MAG: hypothetical protein ACJAYU_000196 [Bradymonadia bacterium]
MRASTSGGDTELFVSNGGVLIADASAGAEILFTADGSTTAGSWEGLRFDNGASATLSNVEIRYADYPLDLGNGDDADFSITGVDIVAPRARGISSAVTSSQTLTLTDVDIDCSGGGASTYGMFFSAGSATVSVTESSFTGCAVGIHATNIDLVVDHTIFDSNTTDGISFVASLNGTWDLQVAYSTFYANADAIQVTRGTSSSSRRVKLDITNSVFGNNTYIVRDLAAYTSYRAAFDVFQRNVWWGDNQFTNVNGPTSNLDNLNYNGLLADPDGGDFEPTERSPARYFSPANPAMTLGAVAHAGAASPAGVHGFW